MKTTPYRTSDYLKTRADVVAYLNASLKDGEPIILLKALRNVAQSKGGMSMLAKAAGINRESLYRSLSDKGNPKIETIIKIFNALGLNLTTENKKAA
jgi:probable addiction module antidote protein